eukprot:jgi/Psemu1/289151/fgenesh1_pg.327_\
MEQHELEVAPVDHERHFRKVIVLDYSDGCTIHVKRRRMWENQTELAYFKRSFVRKKDGYIYDGNCSDFEVIPYSYSGTKAMLIPLDSPLATKDYEAELRGCDGHCFGQVYLRHLRDAKIIVTCNPFFWEGDFRLWESFLSGAMVMVDEMIITTHWMPNPPVHGVHFVTYQANNATDFKTKLAYYSDPSNLDETEAIAKRGYKHALEHHMPTDRVDYILHQDRVRRGLEESVTDPSKRAALGLSSLSVSP